MASDKEPSYVSDLALSNGFPLSLSDPASDNDNDSETATFNDSLLSTSLYIVEALVDAEVLADVLALVDAEVLTLVEAEVLADMLALVDALVEALLEIDSLSALFVTSVFTVPSSFGFSSSLIVATLLPSVFCAKLFSVLATFLPCA